MVRFYHRFSVGISMILQLAASIILVLLASFILQSCFFIEDPDAESRSFPEDHNGKWDYAYFGQHYWG